RLAVEFHRSRPVELDLDGRRLSCGDPRVREVLAPRQPAACLQPVVEAERAVEDVDAPVVGVGARGHLPTPEVLAVHREHEPAAPEGAPGDEVGDEPVEAAVEEHRTEVDAQLAWRPSLAGRSTGGADRAGEIAAGEDEGWGF